MAVARFLFRVTFRARWPAWTAIGLIAGIAGGVVMAAAAGARRTDSAPERAVLDTRSADVLINPNNGSLTDAQWRAMETRPEVAQWARVSGVAMLPLSAAGKPDISFIESATGNNVFSNPDGRWLHSIDRVAVLAGAIPRADDEDALVVNETAARRDDLHVGSRLHVGFYNVRDLENASPANLPKPALVRDLRVAAIVRSLDDATRAKDDPRLIPSFQLTQALSQRIVPLGSLYGGLAVTLHDPGKSAEYEAAARKIAGSSVLDLQEVSGTLQRARRGNRPYVLALWLFALLAAIAGGAVVAQLVTRQQRSEAGAQPVLRAIGATRPELVGAAALRALYIGVAAAVVAVVVATAGSLLMPIGPMRVLETHRGVDFEWTIIGWGALALMLLIVLVGTIGALRRPRLVPRRASRLGDALARTGAPVPAVTGVRLALDPGRGEAAVPVWSTVLGVGLALAALVATFGYAASLTKFTTTPRLYGWVWSYQVEPAGNTSVATLERTATDIARKPDMHATVGAYAQMAISGNTIGAVGLQPGRDVPVIDVVRGHAPEQNDEIALGATTLRSLHRHVGDSIEVSIGSVRRPFRIVGQAVFPRFAPYPASEPTGLGVGAATTLDALARFGPLDNQERSPLSASPFVMVDATAPGASSELRRAVFGNDPAGGLVLGAQRPNEVTSYQHLERTPLVLAGLLVLLAVATMVHLLVTAVRRRRRDLGMFRALGCTAGQMRRTVLAQASTLIALSLVVAIPLGVIAGRFLWSATARWLGVPVLQIVPVGEIALVALGAFVVGIAAALVPAIRAGRVDPAEILRSE